MSADPSISMMKVVGRRGEESGTLAVVGLTSICDKYRKAEVSIVVGPENRGKGAGFMSLTLLLNHAFLHRGLNSVWAEVLASNPGNELFKKLGFAHTGTEQQVYFKQCGWEDAHRYQMLAETWTKKLLPSS